MATTQLIEIQHCQVSQLVPNQKDIPLSDGPLALLDDQENKGLKLVCGTAAFSLKTGTSFYTHVDSERIYIFSPSLNGATALEKSSTFYVKVLLPEIVQTEPNAMRHRDQFEEILIDRGFLKTSFEAVAEEFSTSVSNYIDGKAHTHLSNPENKGDVGPFSQTTHMVMDKAVEYSHVAAEVSEKISKTVGNAAVTAGQKISAFVSQHAQDSPVLQDGGMLKEGTQTRETADKIGSAASTAASTLSSVAAGIGAGYVVYSVRVRRRQLTYKILRAESATSIRPAQKQSRK